MRKKDIFGRNIPGVTDRHDRKEFESYLNGNCWNRAYIWAQIECKYLHSKVVRQKIAIHLFGILSSFVLAFFTWVVLYEKADKAQLEAFPLYTICQNIFVKLCETVPGGKNAVIFGLIALPFVVCGIIALIGLIFSAVKLNVDYKKIREKTKDGGAADVKAKLDKLVDDHYKYSTHFYSLIFYTLFAGIFTGGVMVFSSVGAGFNPFEYLIVALICDAVYAIFYLAVLFVYYWFQEIFGVDSYRDFIWTSIVERAMGITHSSYEEPPPMTLSAAEEKAIQDLLDSVYGDLEGSGKRDY